jgi:hypothetical protein
MTGTLTRTPPAEPRPDSHDRSVPLLIGAAVLVLLVVGAVLVFGVDRPPSLTTLADDPTPAPSAAVAYLTEHGEGTCVRVAQPDGTLVGPWCDRMGSEVVGWDGDGILLRRFDGVETIRAIDPTTGEVVGRAPDRPWREPYDQAVVWTEYRDGELIVRSEADDTELWRVEASDRYELRSSAGSADGDWVAMVDSADRLLVVPADGTDAPRVWASDVADWQWPIWEGTSWER